MQLLNVRKLTKTFDETHGPVVDCVEFSVRPGEIFGLLGPSGCGKTTMLRLIAGFESPDTGDILLNERSILATPAERREIGLVFQDYALFPHLSVADNIAFALRRVPKREKQERIAEALRLVGLTRLASRMPHEISGGQQQRVALGRAIAAEPKIILLDEPFSNLDASLRESTRSDVRDLLKKTGMSAILVTHDQEEALSISDRLAVMNEGHIEQIGTPETVYHRPRTPFVAQFLGRTNIVHGTAAGDTADTPLGRLPLDRTAHGSVLLSLRPEHLELLREEGEHPPATVLVREFKGHDITYRIELAGIEYLAHTEYYRSFHPGQGVRVVPRAPAVVLQYRAWCTEQHPKPENGNRPAYARLTAEAAISRP